MDLSNNQADPKRHTYRQSLQPRSARDTQPWTTARCHRLLRPLKTHIFALRREIELDSAEVLSGEDSGDENSGTLGGPTSKTSRFQHTYSRRGRKPAPVATDEGVQTRSSQDSMTSKTMKLSSKKALQPGEITLPTPVIRRARQQAASPMPQPTLERSVSKIEEGRPDWVPLGLLGGRSRLNTSSTISTLENELLSLRYRISSTRFSRYESILRTLDALLAATTAQPPIRSYSRPSSGTTNNTKSLMAMCLRKVPEYIGELEYWEQRDAEEQGSKSTLQSSKVSNEVYEAIEEMLPSSRGCAHLRTVVREHAMRVVRDAVVEGLLDDGFSLLLVALCTRKKAYIEAESLLEVVLDRSYPKPKSVDSTFDESRRLAALKTLRDLARESSRPQFMLRQLSKLLKLQQLPAEWLSTKEFALIWSGIVKVVAGDAVCDNTVSCAIHIIVLLSSQAMSAPFTLRPQRGDLHSLSQQTLISAITTLTSFPLLRQDSRVGSTHSSGQNTTCAISKRIDYIVEACIHEIKKARKSSWISTALNLSAYLTETTQSRSATHVSELWHRILQSRNRRNGKQSYESAVAFLCSLARCCGQGAAQPSHHYLGKFCEQLDSMVTVQDGKSRQLRTDCAFFLAERTNDLRDLAFAESFNGNTDGPESEGVEGTPRKTSSAYSVTGFRWDGDISEWVTATPAPHSQRSSTKQTHEVSRESADHLCQAETDDSGVSDVDGASMTRHDSYERTSRRWTRSSASSRRATVPSTRKRNLAVTSKLLSLQTNDNEAGEAQEDEDEELRHPRGSSSSSNHQHRASGQENWGGVVVVAAGSKKRRRVGDAAVLKPRRALLRTITNPGHEDMSDDELGL